MSFTEIKRVESKQDTLKIQLSFLLNSLCVQLFLFFFVFSCGLLQRLCVNNIPRKMPLFYSPSQFNPPLSTCTTLETYLDWPGRAAKRFVKLPPVISPARRIAAEPTHVCTRWCGHTKRLHAAPLSSAAFICTLAAARMCRQAWPGTSATTMMSSYSVSFSLTRKYLSDCDNNHKIF